MEIKKRTKGLNIIIQGKECSSKVIMLGLCLNYKHNYEQKLQLLHCITLYKLNQEAMPFTTLS